jgi:hypothetical protein
MARYGADYQLDSGVILRSVSLSVFIVDLEARIVGSPFGGERIGTTNDFDIGYLPSNFVSITKVGCCSLPIPSPRHVRAYLSDTRYLYIPCPFRGSTPDFMQFFKSLANNSLVRFAELHGESVGSQYTLNFASQ